MLIYHNAKNIGSKVTICNAMIVDLLLVIFCSPIFALLPSYQHLVDHQNIKKDTRYPRITSPCCSHLLSGVCGGQPNPSYGLRPPEAASTPPGGTKWARVAKDKNKKEEFRLVRKGKWRQKCWLKHLRYFWLTGRVCFESKSTSVWRTFKTIFPNKAAQFIKWCSSVERVIPSHGALNIIVDLAGPHYWKKKRFDLSFGSYSSKKISSKFEVQLQPTLGPLPHLFHISATLVPYSELILQPCTMCSAHGPLKSAGIKISNVSLPTEMTRADLHCAELD